MSASDRPHPDAHFAEAKIGRHLRPLGHPPERDDSFHDLP